MKNKGRKYFTIGATILIILLVILNFDKIKFTFSMIKASKSPGFEENMDDELIVSEDLENPLERHIGENEEANIDVVSEETSDKDDNLGKDKEKLETSSENLERKIVTKYNGRLNQVQADFQGKLNSLISEAYDEYVAKGKKGASSIGIKYLGIGTDLEAKCDEEFYQILKEFEEELIENNLDTGVVGEVENYYHNFKSLEKQKIIGKAKSMM